MERSSSRSGGILPRERSFNLGGALFFVFLLSMLIALYDRYRSIYLARFGDDCFEARLAETLGMSGAKAARRIGGNATGRPVIMSGKPRASRALAQHQAAHTEQHQRAQYLVRRLVVAQGRQRDAADQRAGGTAKACRS